ncbi:MAG: DNA-binding protein, partial [Calothrix sp. MO_192.B10]|nr:DNA-binding protein [Calothrix sp. MO_192.B10]
QINHNRKHKTLEPVITIRQGNRKTYCHIAQIKGSCQIVYQPDNPLSCGAVVWIEVLPDTVVIPQLLTPMRV